MDEKVQISEQEDELLLMTPKIILNKVQGYENNDQASSEEIFDLVDENNTGRILPDYLRDLEQYLDVHGKTFFKCKICDKILKSPTGSFHHVILLHGYVKEKTSKENEIIFGKGLPKSFRGVEQYFETQMTKKRYLKCKLCHKDILIYAARQHIMRKHGLMNFYKCTLCDKSFLDASILNKHIQYAHKRKFQCKRCEKTFKCMSDLYEHLRNVHEGHESSKTQFASEMDHFKKIQTEEEQTFNEKYENVIQDAESFLKNDDNMLCVQEGVKEKIEKESFKICENPFQENELQKIIMVIVIVRFHIKFKFSQFF